MRAWKFLVGGRSGSESVPNLEVEAGTDEREEDGVDRQGAALDLPQEAPAAA